MTTQPTLRPLHGPELMSKPKLDGFRKLETLVIIESLQPGRLGALKVKLDGTVLDGHHRLEILRERGIDVEQLPREIIDSNDGNGPT